MSAVALPAAEASRPRTVVVGALFGTAAVFVAFAALFALYVQQRQHARAAGEEWFPEGSVELGPAGMAMMTLVLSMVTVQWAVHAARNEDRPHGLIALAVTIMFGAAVLNQYWFIYQDTGFAIDAGRGQLMFYVVTGAFIAMLLVAMAMMVIVTIRTLLGPFGPGLVHVLQGSALYWHMCVLAYFLVWYGVFITK